MLSQGKFCRLCGLLLSDAEEGTEFFDGSNVLLKNLLNVTILENESLLNKVCDGCIYDLKNFDLFKIRFFKAQAAFELVIGQKCFIEDRPSTAITNPQTTNDDNLELEMTACDEAVNLIDDQQSCEPTENRATQNEGNAVEKTTPQEKFVVEITAIDPNEVTLPVEVDAAEGFHATRNTVLCDNGDAIDPLDFNRSLKVDPLSNLSETYDCNDEEEILLRTIKDELYFDRETDELENLGESSSIKHESIYSSACDFKQEESHESEQYSTVGSRRVSQQQQTSPNNRPASLQLINRTEVIIGKFKGKLKPVFRQNPCLGRLSIEYSSLSEEHKEIIGKTKNLKVCITRLNL